RGLLAMAIQILPAGATGGASGAATSLMEEQGLLLSTRGAATLAKKLVTETAVTVFRVEGLSNTRIIIGGAGQVSVQGDSMLFLNFGSRARAEQFLATRVGQGMPGVQMKSFQVP